MNKRTTLIFALSLAISSPFLPVCSAFAEEMVIESAKMYTAGTLNGQNGFWTDFSRKRYTRNEFSLPTRVGRYDATILEALVQLSGLNRALTTAEMTAIYTKYGIPLESSANYDGAAYHDFNWNTTLATIKADISAGRLTAPKASAADVTTVNQLLSASNSAALLDSLGAASLNSYILQAFTDNGGGSYIYAGDTSHNIGYAHGMNYRNDAQVDLATFNRVSSRTIQDVMVNNPADLKKLTGLGNIDALMQAGRFTALASMIDKGINPFGLSLDTWVNTCEGPVHIIEDQPSAARLRELSRFLVASTWTTHSPIALDLNHDGKIGVTGPSTAQKRLHKNKFEATGAVYFDIMANGKKQHIEWLAGDGDGFLVDDSNGRVTKAAAAGGVIDAHSLFGDAIGYSNGYHKLANKPMKTQVAAVFSPTDKTNWNSLFKKKAVLKGKDLHDLKVWVDKNHDALVQSPELMTLASLGVSELGTVPVIRKNGDGEYVIQSHFIQKGKRFMTEDVWFAEDPTTADKN